MALSVIIYVMKYLIGIDEAGRGPLAGPVSVGVAMVAEDFDWSLLKGVKDSKQLSADARERIFAEMKALEKAGMLRFAVAFSSVQLIEQKGIVFAVQSALNRSLRILVKDGPCHKVLLDGGLKAPAEFTNQKTIIRGDQSEPIISLASIAAKVLRDRRMRSLARSYPAYGFDIHKGYGTLAHRTAIKRLGLSEIHRPSFCSRIIDDRLTIHDS